MRWSCVKLKTVQYCAVTCQWLFTIIWRDVFRITPVRFVIIYLVSIGSSSTGYIQLNAHDWISMGRPCGHLWARVCTHGNDLRLCLTSYYFYTILCTVRQTVIVNIMPLSPTEISLLLWLPASCFIVILFSPAASTNKYMMEFKETLSIDWKNVNLSLSLTKFIITEDMFDILAFPK